MIRRTSLVFLEVVVALIAIAALIVAAGAWRLSQGPVSLAFLTPYIGTTFMPENAPVKITVADTRVIWAGWERGLDVVALDATIEDREGSRIALLPEVSVAVDLESLANGQIRPTSLELIRPRMRFTRSEDGIRIGVEDAANAAGPAKSAADGMTPEFLSALMGQSDDANNPFSKIERISVIGGAAVIRDEIRNVSWVAPLANISLSPSVGGLLAEYSVDIRTDDKLIHIVGEANVDSGSGAISVSAGFSDLWPDRLAKKLPKVERLDSVVMPLSGQVGARLSATGRLLDARFSISGDEGRIAVPELYDEPLDIESIAIRGRVEDGGNRMTVDGLSIDLGGPVVIGKFSGTVIGGSLHVNGEAALRELPTDEVADYWPKGLSPGGKRWVAENLKRGVVTELRVTVVGRADLEGGAFEMDSVNGSMTVAGTEVHYLRPLPPVRNVSAQFAFGGPQLDIALKSGKLRGLNVSEGTIRLTKLGSDDERLALEVVLEGPFRDVMTVLDHPRLNYGKAVGIDPAGVDGAAAIRLAMAFPLIDALKFDAIDIRAGARLSGFSQQNAFQNAALTDGELEVKLDKNAMEVEGTVKLQQIPMGLRWFESFAAAPEFRRRYDLKTVLDEKARALFGVDFPGFVTGPAAAGIAVVERDGGGQQISADVNLEGAGLVIPVFDWRKEPAKPATLKISLDLQDGVLRKVTGFDLAAEGLRLAGDAEMDEAGRFRAARFSTFRLGRNDFAATVEQPEEGQLRIVGKGRALDAGPILSSDDVSGGSSGPRLEIEGEFQQAWLGAERAVSDFVARFIIENGTMPLGSFNADLGAGKRLRFSIDTVEGKRRISAFAEDAGATFAAFDVTDKIESGTLNVYAERVLAQDESPWVGKLELKEFSVIDAPGLVRTLTVASLTGIADLAAGKGISFTQLDLPFTFKDELLTIKEGRAVGSELGVTASGTVDLNSEATNLDGTLVPAYTINNFFGKIPILGPALIGEKGSGVFAASFRLTGKISDPEVSVNPLSALTPGFLRNLLKGFASGDLEPGKSVEDPNRSADPGVSTGTQ